MICLASLIIPIIVRRATVITAVREDLAQTAGLSVPSDNILPISHHASCLLPPSEATTTGLLSLDCGRKFSIMSVIIVVVHLLGARAVCVPGVAQFGILDGQTAGSFNTSNISSPSQRTIGNIKLLSSVKPTPRGL